MTIYLNVAERLLLLQLWPRTGAVASLRQFEEAMNRIRLSEAEEIDIGLTVGESGVLSWRKDKGRQRRPFEISGLVHGELVAAFRARDAAKTFPLDALGLWDQIVEGKEPEADSSESR